VPRSFSSLSPLSAPGTPLGKAIWMAPGAELSGWESWCCAVALSPGPQSAAQVPALQGTGRRRCFTPIWSSRMTGLGEHLQKGIERTLKIFYPAVFPTLILQTHSFLRLSSAKKKTFPWDKWVTSSFPTHGPHWVPGVFITG